MDSWTPINAAQQRARRQALKDQIWKAQDERAELILELLQTAELCLREAYTMSKGVAYQSELKALYRAAWPRSRFYDTVRRSIERRRAQRG